MAIEGLGTKASPLLAHNYDELKSACEDALDSKWDTDDIRYVRLVSDINWNNENKEWTCIRLGYESGSNHPVHLDLYGHTIKNVLLGESQSLFMSSYTNSTASEITSTNGNARILNIFSNGSNAVFRASGNSGGGTPVSGKRFYIYNTSISINATSMIAAAFVGWVLKNCSLFYVNSTPSLVTKSSGVVMDINGDFDILDNTDIYLDITNYNRLNNTIFYNRYSDRGAIDCRFSGKIIGDAEGGKVEKDGLMFGDNYGVAKNCVCNIEMKTSKPYRMFGSSNKSTGVINGEKLKDISGGYLDEDGANIWGMFYAKGENIKNYDWLLAHGFNVEKIGD